MSKVCQDTRRWKTVSQIIARISVTGSRLSSNSRRFLAGVLRIDSYPLAVLIVVEDYPIGYFVGIRRRAVA